MKYAEIAVIVPPTSPFTFLTGNQYLPNLLNRWFPIFCTWYRLLLLTNGENKFLNFWPFWSCFRMIAPAAFKNLWFFRKNLVEKSAILPVLRQQLQTEHAVTKISSPFTDASFATAGAVGTVVAAENFDKWCSFVDFLADFAFCNLNFNFISKLMADYYHYYFLKVKFFSFLQPPLFTNDTQLKPNEACDHRWTATQIAILRKVRQRRFQGCKSINLSTWIVETDVHPKYALILINSRIIYQG